MDESHDINAGPDPSTVPEPVLDEVTVGADVDVSTAEREIAEAVGVRHSVARRYVTSCQTSTP